MERKYELVGVLASHNVCVNGEDGVFVDYICIAKRLRRCGLARHLLHTLPRRRIWLIVRSFSPAFRAYLRMGFVPADGLSGMEPTRFETCMTRMYKSGTHKIVDTEVQRRDTLEPTDWESLLNFVRRNGSMSKQDALRVLADFDSAVEYRLFYQINNV